MRKDVKTGMLIGFGLVFVGWVLFALFSDSLQERRQKQLASEPADSSPVHPLTTTAKPPAQKVEQKNQQVAEPVQPVFQKVEIHIVETGETLSSISVLYYGTSGHWQKILNANSDILTDPSQLRPGMRLKIPAR
jgi:nucleoid-associated protein YgaU